MRTFVQNNDTGTLTQPRLSSHGTPAQASAPAKTSAPEKTTASGARLVLPVEIAFLSDYGFASATLLEVAHLAISQGATAEAVLIANGKMTEKAYYEALARHLGVSFLDEAISLASGFDLHEAIASGLATLPGEGASAPT